MAVRKVVPVKPQVKPVKPVAPAPVKKVNPYVPTNPGWGNAGTAAKLKALNPSGTTTLGWTPAQGASYASQARPWEGYTPPDVNPGGDVGGGGGMPGWGFDFGMLESQRDEDIGSFRSGMGTKIKQALIDLGLADVSQLDPEARSYVDDATIEAAKANKYSLFAQLQQKANRATAQSRAKLAARGMLSSGQLSKEAQDVLEQTEAARYTGVREFTGGVGDLVGQYAARQREWANKIAEARMQAAAMGYSGYGGGGGGGGGGEWMGPVGAVGRPGEWADLPIAMGWDPSRGSDAQYDLSGATNMGGYWLGPQGQRYDENGRVI